MLRSLPAAVNYSRRFSRYFDAPVQLTRYNPTSTTAQQNFPRQTSLGSTKSLVNYRTLPTTTPTYPPSLHKHTHSTQSQKSDPFVPAAPSLSPRRHKTRKGTESPVAARPNITPPPKKAMITSTTTTMLRSGVTRSCGLQPTLLLRSATSSPYSTITAASPFAGVRSKLTTSDCYPAGTILTLRPRQSPSSLSSSASSPTTSSARRHASTSTNDAAADAAAAARAAARAEAYAKSNPDMPPLDWNTFFQLRKTRRRWQVAFSAIMSTTCGTGGAVLLSTGAADALTGQVPLDPVLTLGLMTIGFAGLGWVVGPSLGNAVFYLLKRKFKAPMTVVSSLLVGLGVGGEAGWCWWVGSGGIIWWTLY